MIKELLEKDESEAAEALGALGYADGKRALKELTLLGRDPLTPHLDTISSLSLASPSPDQALTNLERVTENMPNPSLIRFLEKRERLENLVTVCGSSNFLSTILARSVELFEEFFIGGALNEKKGEGSDLFEKELREWTEGAHTFDEMAAALRGYRNREYLRIGARDLLKLASMEEVTDELSQLASASLDQGLAFCMEEMKREYGRPLEESGKEAEFAVIGLGKLGGGELNFLSDIDILYVYSTERGETTGGSKGSLHLHPFFIKLSERLTRLISAVTGEGFVFRVDLDLRPRGRSGELANSLRSVEVYYESWGQTWERGMLIKARPVAGSAALGKSFLEIVEPFVYRKYLDFATVEEIKAMKEKIDLALLKRSPDAVDVKLGAGGIREIEFFCQALQLVHGGKVAEVREAGTLRALGKLERAGFLPGGDASTLKESYIFLRNLEHRIQIVEGRQTQAVPARAAELKRLARMMGFEDTAEKGGKAGEKFREAYGEKTSGVYDIYKSLFYGAEKSLIERMPEGARLLFAPDLAEEEGLKNLASLGFPDPGAAWETVKLLREGSTSEYLPPRAGTLRERLLPFAVAKAAASPEPERSLSHMERFLSAIGPRVGLYSILTENPSLTEQLLKLFGSSEFLSRALSEQPANLDLLLSEQMGKPHKSAEESAREFGAVVSEDYEESLDGLRRLRNQELFRIGLNDVLGRLSPAEATGQISSLAEAALGAGLRMAFEETAKRYGRPSDERFAIIALGKFGGSELSYGSDLDILFVYADGEGETSGTGKKTVSNHEFFVALAQRIINALSMRTREGVVFTVDMRLRPSGSSGPLVISLDSLIGYHREKARIWERQALTKVRAVCGDEPFGREVISRLNECTYGEPPSKEEMEELLGIRKRMETEIAKERAGRFNIKTGRGGVVDIEFLVQ
ncbi:MAG: bifunctional [glutamate--ammonia ligase]-adenylyl-L-tyrosine phosphorylase/[glutamate--ammonia-ligase] adenylyltransferase, partial [Thermodesulfobacteriota bacterium]